MHRQAEKTAARVLHRVCPLPSFPFQEAAAVVSSLSVPLKDAPPLSTLCSDFLDGFSAEDGASFYRAAQKRHPRHQLPFVLSRVAASRAIASLPQQHALSAPLVFTGDRVSASSLHGCELSLSHEDAMAAALAWQSIDQPVPPLVSATAATGKSTAASKPASSSKRFCAVDVCPVSEVHRVRQRFPRLRERWLPQCVAEASSDAVHAALTAIEAAAMLSNSSMAAQSASTETLSHSLSRPSRRRVPWWRQLSPSCSSETDAYASVVLAQHWGARECAVKLLGVSDRVFPYATLQRDADGLADDLALPFTNAFMTPRALYKGVVTGAEKAVWLQAGRVPVVYLYTWLEWCPASDGVADMPHVVIAACC